MKKILLTATLILAAVTACKISKETPKTDTAVVKPALDCSTSGRTYSSIKFIFDQNCISCHNYERTGGYNFLSIADVKRAAQNGELLGTIKWQKGFSAMPQMAAQLDQAFIDQIECWIKHGMKE